jgi:2'-5' RNA ligase
MAAFARRLARLSPVATRAVATGGYAARSGSRSGCWQSPTPFHPHITLLRDASHAVTIPPPGFHWTFPVTEFVLYESQFAGGRLRYTALNRWTLKT